MTSASINGMEVGNYSYDSLGRRVKKSTAAGETIFVYDQFGQLISEYDKTAGTYLKDYVYLNGRPLALAKFPPPTGAPSPAAAICSSIGLSKLTRDQVVLFCLILSPFFGLLIFRSIRDKKRFFLLVFSLGCLGAVGVLFVSATYIPQNVQAAPPTPPAEELYYYHLDHLGTPARMTDQAKKVVWAMDCSPFQEICSITSSITNNLRFPGQYYDAETGLNYNWHRYYKPELGRYLNSDPLGINSFDFEYPMSINLFNYVLNRPIVFSDPMGLYILSKCDLCDTTNINTLKDKIYKSCLLLDRNISNLPLRRCIKNSCLKGNIFCKGIECDSHKDWMGYSYVGSLEFPIREMVICLKNTFSAVPTLIE